MNDLNRNIGFNMRWLTIKEAAAYMRMSPRKVYDLMVDGELAYVKIGRKRTIDVQDIDTLMMKNKIDAGKALKLIRKKIAG